MQKIQWRNTTEVFGLVAKLFHWGVGLGLIGMLIVGFYMASLDPSSEKSQLIGLHKSTGALLLVLIIFRLAWRHNNLNPKLPNTLHPIHHFMARLSVPVLYLCMFLMPLSGYVMSVAAGYPVGFYGLFNLPMLVPKSEILSKLAFQTHVMTAYFFVGILVVHVMASLYHHYVLKDNVMRRMWHVRNKKV